MLTDVCFLYCGVTFYTDGRVLYIFFDGNRDVGVALDAELPDATEDERRWAQCMMLSRALMHHGKGTVMMPFFDLLNHGDSAYHQSFQNKAVALASRDLKAGTSLHVLHPPRCSTQG